MTPPERVYRYISKLLITHSLTNDKNVEQTTHKNRMVPQSLRLISALMATIEEERRALCAGVLQPLLLRIQKTLL